MPAKASRAWEWSMLYKVTPAMEAPRRKKAEAGEGARKRRKTAVYDADGNEVLISLMCLKCRTVKPLAQFGLRKMADGAVRNQPWCRGCRGAVPKKEHPAEAAPTPTPVETPAVTPVLEVAPAPVLLAAEPPAILTVAEPAPALGGAEPTSSAEQPDSAAAPLEVAPPAF